MSKINKKPPELFDVVTLLEPQLLVLPYVPEVFTSLDNASGAWARSS